MPNTPSVSREAASDSAVKQSVHTKEDAVKHRFFDKTNVILAGLHLGAVTADAITTQHLAHLHRVEYRIINGVRVPVWVSYKESNPLARPFVEQGWLGEAGYSLLMLSADRLISYGFHRKNHHRLERVVPIVFTIAATYGAVHNGRKW